MNLAIRLARREMRSGLGGFRLFIACLALGVAAIAAILSFSRAVEEGLRADAREILGGDVAISLLYREATPEQMEFLNEPRRARALGRQPRHGAPGQDRRTADAGPAQGGRARLSALRRHRAATTASRSPTRFAKRDGVWGAVVEEAALRRMNMALGDKVRIGEVTVEVRGLIAREPDRGLNAFASLGPRLMMPFAALAELGPDPAGQPAHLGISPAAAPGRDRPRHHRRAQGALPRRRLAGAGARPRPAAASASGSTG